MSQRTKSHPGVSRAGDSTNYPTEGSEKSSAANAQPRGFITSIMSPAMRPAMSARRRSQVRPTTSIVGAPESASSQLRGLIISVPGVHDCRTSPSTPRPSPPSVRTISLCSVSCPTPARAVDRPAKISILVFVVIDDDIRPGHRANELTGSPARVPSHSSTVALSRRQESKRERRTASPEGSRSNALSLQLHSLTGLWKSGSKMDNPLSGSCWRGRWPRSKPVPEILSAPLRWAK